MISKQALMLTAVVIATILVPVIAAEADPDKIAELRDRIGRLLEDRDRLNEEIDTLVESRDRLNERIEVLRANQTAQNARIASLMNQLFELTVGGTPQPASPQPPTTPEKQPERPSNPETTIEPLPGSGSMGCQDTEEGCYNYPVLTVDPGTEITFRNTDNTAHTLTAGTTADGPSGAFDSGIVLAGGSYVFTLDNEGIYDHYCAVHPWKIGQIIVGDSPPPTTEPSVISDPPSPSREPESSQDALQIPTTTIEPMPGSSTSGCQDTEEGCYNYPVLTVDPGTEITFRNTDNAAHTLTGGSPADGPSGAFDSGLVMVGASYKFTLDEEGIYDHYCLVHPWMIGQIIVGNPPSPAALTPVSQSEEYYIRITSNQMSYTVGDVIHYEASMPPCSAPTYGIDGETMIRNGGETRVMVSQIQSDGSPVKTISSFRHECNKEMLPLGQGHPFYVNSTDIHTVHSGSYTVGGGLVEGTYALRVIAERDANDDRFDVFSEFFPVVAKSKMN